MDLDRSALSDQGSTQQRSRPANKIYIIKYVRNSVIRKINCDNFTYDSRPPLKELHAMMRIAARRSPSAAQPHRSISCEIRAAKSARIHHRSVHVRNGAFSTQSFTATSARSLRSSIGPTVTAQRGGGRPGLYRRLDMNATPLAAGGPHRRKCDAQRAPESSLRWRCRRQAHSGTMHVSKGRRGEGRGSAQNCELASLDACPEAPHDGVRRFMQFARAPRDYVVARSRTSYAPSTAFNVDWQYQMKPPIDC